MEKREEALREALSVNAEETTRWTNYQNENKTAIENLDKFLKHLTVDVMVPIGRKAFMPGQLLHTNEVLVGHFQGYFSKCSAHKAKEICELRMQKSVEHLEKLKQEQELWQNKLEKPYLDGAMPTGHEQEIIEDYDEKKEEQWRIEHAQRLKQAKRNEKIERDVEIAKKSNAKTDDDILKMLEEAELMEELEKELETIENVDVCDDTIKKLMAGEMELPPSKQRIAHNRSDKSVAIENKTKLETEFLQGVVKKSEIISAIGKTLPTNNNTTPNPDIMLETREHNSDSAELPEEIAMIREQAKYLPAADQIGFYEYQLQIAREKMRSYTQQQFDEKLQALEIIEQLEDLLDEAECRIGDQELAECDMDVDAEVTNANTNTLQNIEELENTNETKSQKRRISFALENQTLEFRKNETVSEMMPKPDTQLNAPKRDIIKLDEPLVVEQNISAGAAEANVSSKKQAILDRVNQCRSYIAENQSMQDFHLVENILKEADGKCHTLYIHFTHSPQVPAVMDDCEETSVAVDENGIFVPRTPADIYTNYMRRYKEVQEGPKTIYLNSYAGEELVKTPVLKEVYRQQAYEDPKAKFSQPARAGDDAQIAKQVNDTLESNDLAPKSILRNKEAIAKEQHTNSNATIATKKKKKKPVDENDEYMSAYSKVMNEVVEKPLTEPEPLPKTPYVDAHAPKKRISRFKQMRANLEKS